MIHAELSGVAWTLSLVLEAEAMRRSDSLPTLLHRVCEMQGPQGYRAAFHTVVVELYNNALEHGLLKLNSSLKNGVRGFSQYYAVRKRRLAELDNGTIHLHFRHEPIAGGGRLVVRVEDTGQGFDFQHVMTDLESNRGVCGRGISLVKAICERVEYFGVGNQVEASFVWETAFKR